jgi:GNAT superfamily N-acetyltransferase
MVKWRLRGALQALPVVRQYRADRLGAFAVRLLEPADAAVLDDFTARHLPRVRAYVTRQCRERWPDHGFGVGAFDTRGRMIGFGFVDEYAQEGVPLPGWWARTLFVTPAARRLGAGRAVAALRYQEARRRGLPCVFVDVRQGNHPAVRLQLSLGAELLPADGELPLLTNRLLRRPGEAERVVFRYDCS